MVALVIVLVTIHVYIPEAFLKAFIRVYSPTTLTGTCIPRGSRTRKLVISRIFPVMQVIESICPSLIVASLNVGGARTVAINIIIHIIIM